ncbi:BURP domain-containing protein 10 [Dichanthelium oligosanthes]|uniref:BURP domain-containing protein 10 n=1 Tax=Dichanthelium oligosanthes TaxID=888268 RepID=A0A1E5VX25_9POAL|nr:BURP domain-containing protein 10 [Dichanthelium oligosanthes]
MSRKSFTAILRMFAPVSCAMAENILSVLDLCEHPNPAKGEKKACATSVESMVELAAFVLGTRDLRTFPSSPSVPVEGRAGSKAYRMATVTAITGTGDTMTCHGAAFPCKVFVCHALVPTRVYSVALESDDDGVEEEEEEKVEALVVYHLNTSEFDPEKMPPNVKPGEAPVCHFLNRDDILWAPAATTLGEQGAYRSRPVVAA